MSNEEVNKLIEAEKLKYYNWYYDHQQKENEILIYKEAGRWIVCATDERAAIVTGSCAYFENENNALTNFLSRLRLMNKIRDK